MKTKFGYIGNSNIDLCCGFIIIAKNSVYHLIYNKEPIFSTKKSEVAQAWITKYPIKYMAFN